jgi:phosphosulfolactate synthase (CoM biosynthesis protein A)
MESIVSVDIDTATFLTENGVEVYIGNDLAFTIDLKEEVQEYLNDCCDGGGKIYEEIEEDLDLLIEKFKQCVKLLEDAKR